MRAARDLSPYADPALADLNHRLAVPLQFAMPARDLVAAMALNAGDRVLDAGTGTGAIAAAAAAIVGPGGVVIGVDPSLAMLAKAGPRVAAARIPDLPFADACFDAVTAGFVLTHVRDVHEGLVELRRVLRPGGRLGVTTWGDRVTPAGSLWREVAGEFAPANELKKAVARVIPWERWLTSGRNLRDQIAQCGLHLVEISRREYSVALAVADYLALKDGSVEGMLLRARLGRGAWDTFCGTVADRFAARFGTSVLCLRDAHIAVAVKPAPRIC